MCEDFIEDVIDPMAGGGLSRRRRTGPIGWILPCKFWTRCEVQKILKRCADVFLSLRRVFTMNVPSVPRV